MTLRPADRTVDDGERRTIAEAPDQALQRGRHQLAVLAEQATIGPYISAVQ